jgi:hypothetical protein
MTHLLSLQYLVVEFRLWCVLVPVLLESIIRNNRPLVATQHVFCVHIAHVLCVRASREDAEVCVTAVAPCVYMYLVHCCSKPFL